MHVCLQLVTVSPLRGPWESLASALLFAQRVFGSRRFVKAVSSNEESEPGGRTQQSFAPQIQ